jgi:AcrR family transcriptional regulator
MVKRRKTQKNMALTTADRRGELREALLAAVEKTVLAQGYQALRARDLARDVGCAVGAIYNVFPDLDALIYAAKGRTLDLLDRELGAAVAAGSGSSSVTLDIATRQLLALAQAYLRFAIDHSQLWRMLFEYHAPADIEVPVWFRERISALFVHLGAPMRAIVPGLPEDKRGLIGRALFSAVHGIVTLGLEERIDRLSHAAIAGQVATVVRASVAGLTRGEPAEVVRL